MIQVDNTTLAEKKAARAVPIIATCLDHPYALLSPVVKHVVTEHIPSQADASRAYSYADDAKMHAIANDVLDSKLSQGLISLDEYDHISEQVRRRDSRIIQKHTQQNQAGKSDVIRIFKSRRNKIKQGNQT